MADLAGSDQRHRYEDDEANLKLATIRERIKRNFPGERAPLHWRRDTPNRMVSTCGRFSIEKTGEGEAARYTAKLNPATIIGHRRYTHEQALEDCNRHASPLIHEPAAPPAPAKAREP